MSTYFIIQFIFTISYKFQILFDIINKSHCTISVKFLFIYSTFNKKFSVVAKDVSVRDVVLEGDSIIVYNAICNYSPAPSSIAAVIHGIQDISREFMGGDKETKQPIF